MRKIYYIFLVALLAACNRLEEPQLHQEMAPEGTSVKISFQVAVPGESADTKAIGMTPSIDPDGFYIAVFGGSGFFKRNAVCG